MNVCSFSGCIAQYGTFHMHTHARARVYVEGRSATSIPSIGRLVVSWTLVALRLYHFLAVVFTNQVIEHRSPFFSLLFHVLWNVSVRGYFGNFRA